MRRTCGCRFGCSSRCCAGGRSGNGCAGCSEGSDAMTVRECFRQLRAADFARDLKRAVAHRGVKGVDIISDGLEWRWTLFDTQRIVDQIHAQHDPDVEWVPVQGYPILAIGYR